MPAYEELIKLMELMCDHARGGVLFGHVREFIESLPSGPVGIIHFAHWGPLYAVLRGRTATSDGTYVDTFLVHEDARRSRLPAQEQLLRGPLDGAC